MPTPTPTSTLLLLGRVLDKGVVPVAAGEKNVPGDVDGVKDVSTVRLDELVVPMVVEA